VVRGVLLVLSILVAAVAGGILVLPRVVDEPAIRAALTRAVEAATGTAPEIKGAVRLELLPWPHLTIARVAVGERGSGAFEADRIDLDLVPWSLLLGRVEPERLQLVRPQLRLRGDAEDWAGAALRALQSPSLAGLGRVVVVDGTLHLPEGPAIDALDVELVRQPARQRLTLAGTARLGGEPLGLSAEAEPVQAEAPMSLRLELATGAGERASGFSFQGSLQPAPGRRRAEGQVRVTAPDGRLPAWLGLDLPPLPAPAALQGRLALEPAALELADLDLDLAGNRLRGRVVVDLATAGFDLALAAAEAELTPALAGTLRQAGAALLLPEALHGRVNLELGSLAWNGDAIRRLRAEAMLAPGRRLALNRLAATLPGESALAWTGRTAEPVMRGLPGTLSLRAGDLRPLLLWLGADPALLPQGGLTGLDLEGEGLLGPDRLALPLFKARLDASQVEGSLAFAPGVRPRLDLRLKADRMNTALYWPQPDLPDLAPWRRQLAALDLGLELAVERVGHDALRGRGFVLKAGARDGRLELAELRLDELAGASARLRGSVDLADGGDYELDGEAELVQPRGVLRLAGLDLSPELDRLAPLRLDAKISGDAGAAGVTLGLRGTGVSASLEGTLGGPFDPRFLDLAGRADAPDAGRLLEALGWIVPRERPDLSTLAASFEVRRDGGPARMAFQARAGASDLTGEATLEPGERPQLRGRLEAGTLDTALARALYDTAALPLGFPPGSPWAWPGAWPGEPLSWSWLDGAEVGLELKAERLRHGGADLAGAKANLALGHGRLTLSGLALPLAGGSLEGTATLEHEAGHVVLAGDLRLKGARVEALTPVLAPGSDLAGELDMTAEIAGEGLGVRDLVVSLEGEGSLALREGRMQGLWSGDSPDLAGLAFEGPFRIERGIAAGPADGYAMRFEGGEGRLELRLDLLAWITEVHLRGRRGEGGLSFDVELVGVPGRLRQVPPVLPQPGPAAGSP
jgi:hypothetical protein